MIGHRRNLLPGFAPGVVLLSGVLAGVVGVQTARGQCEVQKLTAPDGGPNDFGRSVAMSGDLAVVGDPGVDPDVGTAYVFRYDPASATWQVEAELHSPEPDPDDSYAFRLDVSGNMIVVCAEHASAPEYLSGAAYIYRFDEGSSQWIYEGRLTASDADPSDEFGESCSVSGDVALIGAAQDENEHGTWASGSAYIFRYDGAGWIEEAKLNDPDPEEGEYFGGSVAIRGHIALISAPGKDSWHGAVFTYRFNDGEWVLESQLAPFDHIGYVQAFGTSIALSDDGSVAAIGATKDDGQDGAVYVFRRDGQSWLPEAKLVASDPVGDFPELGFSVSLSPDGRIVAAGAPSDQTLGWGAGAVHLFRRDGGTWQEIAKLFASGGGPGDHLGITVATGHDLAVAGAASEPGSAPVFMGTRGIDCNDNGVPDACDIFEGASEDLNANGIPDECEAIGDLNGDGLVNVRDLLALLAAWGACDDPCPPACTGDTNFDCTVNWIDLTVLLDHWD
ncbi:MAG: hypothetical protein SYC29_18115 [Planctomycetota bacterium]|nr:hypothetical protein [Planctomycetota bacterium]